MCGPLRFPAPPTTATTTALTRPCPQCYELGLGSPVAVSAEHSFGMVDLYDVLRECALKLQARQQLEAAAEAPAFGAASRGSGGGAAATADAPLADASGSPTDVTATPASAADDAAAAAVIQLAIVGRPNVGKSTLVNQMLGCVMVCGGLVVELRVAMGTCVSSRVDPPTPLATPSPPFFERWCREERVLAGPTPGLTRDTTTVELPVPNSGGRSVRLVDTAGMRRWGACPTRGDGAGVRLAAHRAPSTPSSATGFCLQVHGICRHRWRVRQSARPSAHWSGRMSSSWSSMPQEAAPRVCRPMHPCSDL